MIARTFLLSAAVLAAVASPAQAADCRPQLHERVLARSARAVVLVQATPATTAALPRQTIVGCSRHSGRRRIIDVLQRRSDSDPTKLLGLRLAGTRVAYVTVVAPPFDETRKTVIADDAVQGGRRHDLGGWLYSVHPWVEISSWTVDARGNVAWLVESTGQSSAAVMAWHAELGRRMVDTRAAFGGVRLHDGVLEWRRDGAPRSLRLATVPRSACDGRPAGGTLDVDLYGSSFVTTACHRATGRLVEVQAGQSTDILDINGRFLVLRASRSIFDSGLRLGTHRLNLADGSVMTLFDDSSVADAVVDEHGSVAWLQGNAFWVRDASGTREVDGTGVCEGRLTRDGSSVRLSNCGPTVTLNP